VNTISITGGAGFIGRHLASKFATLGYNVVVFDNFVRGSAFPALPGVRIVEKDIRSLSEGDLHGSSVLINLAAISSVRKAEEMPAETWGVNATATWNLMELAYNASIGRFIQASSREVYGNPNSLPVSEDHPRGGINVYGKSKEEAEKLLTLAEAAFGIPVTLLRLANVIGSGDTNDGRVIPRWLTQARAGQPLTVIGGTSKSLDFIPVQYVVRAFVRAALKKVPLTTATPINIGSGHGITLLEVAERIRAMYPQTTVIDEPSKVNEVGHFAAGVTRMRGILRMTPPRDPLADMGSFWFTEPGQHTYSA
jgi:nucleoside-diphosphate-sugar epimerase